MSRYDGIYDVVIIGAGPAGLAAAKGASDAGGKVLLIERTDALGGVLNQCIHPGFGTKIFKEELTGPEFAERYINMIKDDPNIKVCLDTTVLEIKDHVLTLLHMNGVSHVLAKAIVLATGCYERPRAGIGLSGKRLSGILTAGVAQKYVNIMGYLPGKEIVILGSGDIGLIMARRFTIEGANVKMVLEIMPESSGLKRNIVQCLDDFNIPLKLNHTVVEVFGDGKIEALTIAQVDENLKPIPETYETVKCDLLVLSVGLIPYNMIADDLGIKSNPKTRSPFVDQFYETDMRNAYLCGNALHVNDLVDNVASESYLAGKYAYLNNQNKIKKRKVEVKINENLSYIMPSKLDLNNINDKITFSFRVRKSFESATFQIKVKDNIIYKKSLKNVRPAEIENVTILKKVLDEIKDEDFIFEVIE